MEDGSIEMIKDKNDIVIAIVAGGRGTRLGNYANDIPKPLVKLADKPILQLQIEMAVRQGFKNIIILSGYRGELIRQYFGDGSSFGANICHVTESEPRGTAGAVKSIEHLIEGDFFVFYGDTIMDIDLDHFYSFHCKNDSIATLFAHPNDHPGDSDLLEVDQEYRITNFYPKPHEEKKYFKNLVSAALYILNPKVFKFIENEIPRDFGKDIFPRLLKRQQKLSAYISSQYIKDVGTVERIQKVESDLISGKVGRFNRKYKRRAIFLDRDGVINEEVDPLVTLSSFRLIDGAARAIRKINQFSEFLIVVVTNQPSVAKGFQTLEDIDRIHRKMDTLLGQEGAFIDRLYFCPHHPEKGFGGEIPELKIVCNCRKPNTGLIEKAIEDLNIQREGSFLIGDRTADILAGSRSNLLTILVKTGFGGEDKKYEAIPTTFCQTLEESVNYILKG